MKALVCVLKTLNTSAGVKLLFFAIESLEMCKNVDICVHRFRDQSSLILG